MYMDWALIYGSERNSADLNIAMLTEGRKGVSVIDNLHFLHYILGMLVISNISQVVIAFISTAQKKF